MNEIAGRNRLAEETSPYLLQHKDNPVHWWAWGPDALAAAKESGKPILLSIGYAACHWCHVMAHESFEDEATARLMNEHFINIKVDREERPDIDAIYMQALLRLTDHGGWPLTMFLDTDARPFWGGTYFPPENRHGRPSFSHVMTELTRLWREEPDKIRHNADRITASLVSAPGDTGSFAIDDELLVDLANRTVSIMDPEHGGIRGAPKFPQWGIFWFLWRAGIAFDDASARNAVTTFLKHACQGGIYDHLGGGFARYSVDERWLVPHFEKMLYDNALLLDLMTEVWRETRDPLLEMRVEETVAWINREMIAEGGGFAASLDADSEGVEGKFYVWTREEVLAVLGDEDGQFFASIYDVTPVGNFEGRNILNRLGTIDLLSPPDEVRLRKLRQMLFQVRSRRIHPGWDDKVLADWNGLAIAALARAASVFGREDWRDMATRAFDFICSRMTRNTRLMHAYRAGELRAPATAADYANMIRAALRLHEAASERRYLEAAENWTAILDHHYWDNAAGGYATTADDTPDVIIRLRDANDDATPNANGTMIANLVDLFLLTGKMSYLDRAEAVARAFSGTLAERLFGHFGLLAGYMSVIRPQHVTIAIASDTSSALWDTVSSLSLPGAVCQRTTPAVRAADDKPSVAGQAAAYICIGPECAPPLSDPAALRTALVAARRFA
ncbi:MAG: hypothetical protein RLZ98_405 [Pseudomonadota bacterium]|jgi:uncharacterized protein YyaL (SSP411 family)